MRRAADQHAHHVLITGGAGFIGTNLAAHLLARTDSQITIFDNLSRRGVELNLAWLKTLDASRRLRFVRGDVRNAPRVMEAAKDADEIYHLAAPHAGPELLADPRLDFDVNVTGTVNVLEAARKHGRSPMVLFASTGKVYGALDSIPLKREATHLQAADPAFRGVSERMPVDFHCSYACTKSVADQYARDYARLYTLPTVIFRMGCIAGPGQFGNQGQGWVAHFVYSTLAGQPVTVYGDGMQVRDVLHVEDLINAMRSARAYIEITAGKAFNVGGGVTRAVSVNEMLRMIEQICHRPVQCTYEPARPGDQLFYVSDNARLTNQTGWSPRRTLEQTVRDIAAFWHANRKFVMRRSVESGRRSLQPAA
ncbi:MAG TPA: GDP-mannose 4,6-dehydratase [Terracidiphilus sp.]|jgi:CDP-paratose 2-epimerase